MRRFRVMVERRRFAALLALALAAMLAQPLGADSGFWRHVSLLLYAMVFAGTAVLARPVSSRTPVALALIGAWLALSMLDANGLGSGPLHATALAASLALAVVTAWLAFEALARETTEGADALAGAIFGYMLLAIVFGEVYHAIEILSPGAFAVSAQGAQNAELLYFSLVTITTLGYGDVLPVLPFARVLSGVEAAVGTLYVAVLIGRIVGVLTPSKPPDGSGDGRKAEE